MNRMISKSSKFFYSFLLFVNCATEISAQTFSKVIDPSNPVTTDQIPLDYSGSAWLDYDGDSLIDLIVTGVGKNFLYHNDGGGMFSVPIGNPITADLSKHRGVSCGDYDNDGDPDVFMTGSSGGKLYRNDGGTFVLVPSINLGTLDTRGWSPSWGDYDNDGNLDLFIGFPAGAVNFPNRSNILLHNLGAQGVGQIMIRMEIWICLSHLDLL